MGLGPVGPGSIQGGGAAGRARRRGGGFALAGGAEQAAESSVADSGAAMAAGPIAGLIALQESGGHTPPESVDAQARRQAGLALDELRDMQIDLLRGGHDPARLERLVALTEGGLTEGGLTGEGAASLPPALAELVAEVRLRARVELARRRRTLPGH